MGKNMHNIKESKEALSVTSKETGPAGNVYE
jgi:hypothetical protein